MLPVSYADVLAPAVQEFLSRSPFSHWIDGRPAASAGGEVIECVDPGTGRPIAEAAAGSPEDVDRAVASARRAFEGSDWSGSAAGRAQVLRRLAGLVGDHRKTLAEIECLDTGKTLSQALGDTAHFAQTLNYYAGIADSASPRLPLESDSVEAYTSYAPCGVCAVIIPWNFPIVLLGWSIAPALAAGNCVVAKPAEDAVLSTLYIARLAAKAGLPDGVLNVVTGTGPAAGATLAGHRGIARMSFTGSPESGRSVAEACGRNLVPAKLELGGKGAAVVLEDADIKATAAALVKAITTNAGQLCCTATRWLLHRAIHDEFLDTALARMEKIRVGYWSDLKTRMGPLISPRQRDRVLGYLDRGVAEGAEVLLPGGQAEVDGYPEGFYVKPALLTGTPDNIAARDEIFGPVAYVLPFDSDDEAAALVNGSDYGLANSVWSGDIERARKVAECLVAGTNWINAHNLLVPGVPHSGFNKSGLGGGVLGRNTYYDYLRHVTICGANARGRVCS